MNCHSAPGPSHWYTNCVSDNSETWRVLGPLSLVVETLSPWHNALGVQPVKSATSIHRNFRCRHSLE